MAETQWTARADDYKKVWSALHGLQAKAAAPAGVSAPPSTTPAGSPATSSASLGLKPAAGGVLVSGEGFVLLYEPSGH